MMDDLVKFEGIDLADVVGRKRTSDVLQEFAQFLAVVVPNQCPIRPAFRLCGRPLLSHSKNLVERKRLELSTSAMRTRRSAS